MNNLRSSTIQYQEEKTSSNSSSRNSRPATRTAYFQLKTKKKKQRKKEKFPDFFTKFSFSHLYAIFKSKKPLFFFFFFFLISIFKITANPQIRSKSKIDSLKHSDIEIWRGMKMLKILRVHVRLPKWVRTVKIAALRPWRSDDRQWVRSARCRAHYCQTRSLHRWQRTGSKIRVF